MTLLPGLPAGNVALIITLVSIWVVGMLGTVAHELTHYVLARILGADVKFSFTHVDYRFQRVPVAYYRIVNLTPLVAGIFSGVMAYWTYGPFQWNIVWYYGVVFWIGYTFSGVNPEDLSIAAAAGRQSALHRPQLLMVLAGSLVYASGWFMGRPMNAVDFPWGPTLEGVGLTIIVVGLVVVEAQLIREGRHDDTWLYKLQKFHRRQMQNAEAD